MNVKPLGNRVLITVKETEEKTAGGIYIPQTAQEKTQRGVIEAIGTDEDLSVKVGDEIVYDKYAGTQINVDDKEYLIISGDDILAIVE